MKVGFSSTDITPAYGMERPGQASKAFHRGIHDPCLVTACVLDDGINPIALVGVDTLSIKRSIVNAARKLIEEAVGITPTNIMVCASHTHSGGPVAEHTFASEPDAFYIELVTRQIATAVVDAHRKSTEAQIGVGCGEVGDVTFLRRWYMRDGTIWSHPGSRNPDGMIRPDGEIDSSVTVIGTVDSSDRPIGCIVNFACHGTTGLGLDSTSSADWIFFLRQYLKRVFGDEFGVVFFNGACGDVTQVDNREPTRKWSGPIIAKRVGASVAGEAVKILSRTSYGDNYAVSAKSILIEISPRMVTPAMRRWAESHLQSLRSVEGRWFQDELWAREWLALAELNAKEPLIHAELQTITVADAVIVSIPAEYFSALALDIKRRSKFDTTLVATLANGCIGYVGNRDAYNHIEEDGVPMVGGYETMPARWSRCEPGTGELIADRAVALVNSMWKDR